MTRSSARRRKTQAPPDNTRWIVLGVVGAVLVVAGLVWINLTAQSNPVGVTVSSGKIWGKVDAPVTIEEWSDFQ